MIGTDRRVLVAREGRGWRPRSGLRSYELAAIQRVALEGGPGRSGRIVLSLGPLYYQAVSMFFDAAAAEAAGEAARILRASVGPRARSGPTSTRGGRPSV